MSIQLRRRVVVPPGAGERLREEAPPLGSRAGGGPRPPPVRIPGGAPCGSYPPWFTGMPGICGAVVVMRWAN
jgi:hypothetical protein